MKFLTQQELNSVNTSSITVNIYDSLEVLMHEEICNVINMEMSVTKVEQYLSSVIAQKNFLTRERLECIRSQARTVMGTLREPNHIPEGLRRVMIELATIV